MEDPNGLAITLAINNISDGAALSVRYNKLKDAYPIGQMFAVKEPYVCLGPTTGIAEVRVAVPTDMVPLPTWEGEWRYHSPVSTAL